MGDMEIPDELIDQLLGEYEGPEQLTGPDGLINQLRRRLIERAAGVELGQHLGYSPGGEPPEGQPNRRNGTTSKTLRTQDGPVRVELPRDREAASSRGSCPSTGVPSTASTSRSSRSTPAACRPATSSATCASCTASTSPRG